MTPVLYTQNVHMNRTIADSEREARLARIIRADHIRDQVGWALTVFAVWVFGMGIDTYRTFYSAAIQTGNPVNGTSAFIALGVMITAMCFAVWHRKR